jgi:hypothetical protein
VDVSGSVRAFEFTGSFSGSFQGDGSGLRNISLVNLAIDSTKIFSGSATASISPDYGLVVNVPVSASEFSGSGRGLFDIPISALSQEVARIASGSVTASVSPEYGFRVQSEYSGSQFTGSVSIDGNLRINGYVSASMFTGSGAGLFDIPRSALSEEVFRIASGSVTASVFPDSGFIVKSEDYGSQFTGSIFVSGSRGIEIVSGSSYSGSGARLFDIPRSALTPDALLSTLIVSGSVTASVDPSYGFRVTSYEYGSEFTGSIDVSGSVTADAFNAFRFVGTEFSGSTFSGSFE